MPAERFGYSEGDVVDLMCNMDINDFRGTLSVQIVLKDVRMCERDNLEKVHYENAFNEILSGKFDVEQSNYPSMTDFKAAFLCLKSDLKEFDKEYAVDVWKFANKISRQYSVNCSQLKLNIILSVFDEMNLINLTRSSANEVALSLLKTEGKINIESSEFLAKLIKI
jgi:hypothetical protein